MTELLNRFTEAEKWYIDGLCNQFLGDLSNQLDRDAELEDISLHSLLQIIELFNDIKGQHKEVIEQRWLEEPMGDGIYQDLYDLTFTAFEDFFVQLAENN